MPPGHRAGMLPVRGRLAHADYASRGAVAAARANAPGKESPVSNRTATASTPEKLSIPRTAVAALLALVGIAWVVVYEVKGIDGGINWMSDLGDWNWLIGFGLIILGLLVASARTAPLGRGRGIVIGMLGCFLLGLVWIVLYYFTANSANFPLLSDLGQWNLAVGVGFIATGFIFATKWE